MAASSLMPLNEARTLLGVAAQATPAEVRRAFGEAAKAAHPDRPGGDSERFHRVMEAYQRLSPQPKASDRFFQPPAVAAPQLTEILILSPVLAMNGGGALHTFRDGRRIRITLPPGLRTGDKVRAGEVELEVSIRREGAMLVRGDDLWVTVDVAPHLLSEGGRIAVETPLGRRIVWINRRAGARGLVRLAGQGLPARGARPQGHLFLRLTPQTGRIDSAARALLRRFAAAWAA